MRNLNDILQGISVIEIKGKQDVQIAQLQLDSRLVNQHTLFFAISGTLQDGHNYIDKAIDLGAVAIVCEKIPSILKDAITYILVENASIACGQMAANFYHHPSKEMKIIGITGTNGKTTTCSLLHQLFTQMQIPCGLISTVENRIGSEILPSTHTTPNAIAVQDLLSQMRHQHCEYVFMEVSSHAIHQHRIEGISFTVGAFTNISHDHLDYHQNFDEYIRVKKLFFDYLPKNAFAISNLDDKRGAVMLQNTKATKITYGIKNIAQHKAKILENALRGLVLVIDDTEVHCRLIGEFNAYNILCVYTIALQLGFDKIQILQHLSMLPGARGRFETLHSAKENILGIVDYAHSPDALINVLATINKLRNGNECLHTIVGCGGDRDKAKRPLMALVAVEHSDKVIFTSDNPRSESAEQIIAEMEAGVPVHLRKKYISIVNRQEAIKAASSWANGGDIILVAGKGHETYQEINGTRFPFDDKEILKNCFELMDK